MNKVLKTSGTFAFLGLIVSLSTSNTHAMEKENDRDFYAKELFDAAKSGATGDELEKAYKKAHSGIYWKQTQHNGALIKEGTPEGRQLVQETIYARDKQGFTPLHWAAYHGNIQTLDQLISKEELLGRHANINAKGSGDATLLHVAAQGGQVDTISWLLKEGADVNAQTRKGATALHKAIEWEQTDVVKKLVESRNVNLELKNELGETPLHIATIKGDDSSFETLVTAGADIYAENNKGVSVFEAAVAKEGGIALLQRLAKNGKVDSCKLGAALYATIDRRADQRSIASENEQSSLQEREALELEASKKKILADAASKQYAQAKKEADAAIAKHRAAVAEETKQKNWLANAKKLEESLAIDSSCENKPESSGNSYNGTGSHSTF